MKILILGAAGMLGHQVWLKAIEAFGEKSVAGTLRKPKATYSKFGIFEGKNIFDRIDLSSTEEMIKVLEDYKPDWIINCVGITLRKKELGDFERCLDINSMLPHRLALWGLKNNCKVIHFSTDCVFDGAKGGYTELDLPTANDVYGKSKFLGEITYPNALTMRLSVVGREIENKTELVEWIISQKQKTVNGFGKITYSGLTTNQVAKQVVNVIKNHPGFNGLYQLASEPITKYELVKIVNEVYGLEMTVNRDDAKEYDKSLDCGRYAKITGFRKPQWREMITEMKREELPIYDL
jgi:dTDP-4-dehydrorhamnose reductase